MKIVVEPNCMARLMAVANLTAPQEFSGLAFSTLEQGVISVYDFALLDVGTYGYTEIPTRDLVSLMERPDADNMKGWVHRHPMGPGIPGPANWSGRDEQTIQGSPLGGIPDLVRWSWSMVLTPSGWVGRIDNHLTHQTRHLAVEPAFTNEYRLVNTILGAKKKSVVSVEPRRPFLAPGNTLEPEYLDEEALEFACSLTDAEVMDFGITREEIYREVARSLEEIEAGISLDAILDEVEGQPYPGHMADLEQEDWSLALRRTYLSDEMNDVQEAILGSHPPRGDF